MPNLEPPAGSVVRFTRGGYYTYVCYRVDDDEYSWYTTASDSCPNCGNETDPDWDLSSPASWEDIVDFARGGRIDVATGWASVR